MTLKKINSSYNFTTLIREKSTFWTQKKFSVPELRLEMMVLMGMDLPLSAIRQQIASGIDVIVHLGRLPDKSRRVLEIVELDGICDGEIMLSPLYQLKECEGDWKLRNVGALKHMGKLQMAGVVYPADSQTNGLDNKSGMQTGSPKY